MAKKGYPIILKFPSGSPVDSISQYLWGTQNSGATDSRVPIRIAGTITKVTIVFAILGTLGSSENVALYVNKNGASAQTLVTSTAKMDALVQTYTKNDLSIAVAVGDYINVQYAGPTWTTNPTNLSRTAYLRIQ